VRWLGQELAVEAVSKVMLISLTDGVPSLVRDRRLGKVAWLRSPSAVLHRI
jgi:hypothetical protein